MCSRVTDVRPLLSNSHVFPSVHKPPLQPERFQQLPHSADGQGRWRQVLQDACPGVTDKEPSQSLPWICAFSFERMSVHAPKRKKGKRPSFLLHCHKGGPSQITFTQVESLAAEADRKQRWDPTVTRTVREERDRGWWRGLRGQDLGEGPLENRMSALGAGVGREGTWDAVGGGHERMSPRQGRPRGGGRAACPLHMPSASAPGRTSVGVESWGKQGL